MSSEDLRCLLSQDIRLQQQEWQQQTEQKRRDSASQMTCNNNDKATEVIILNGHLTNVNCSDHPQLMMIKG